MQNDSRTRNRTMRELGGRARTSDVCETDFKVLKRWKRRDVL